MKLTVLGVVLIVAIAGVVLLIVSASNRGSSENGNSPKA